MLEACSNKGNNKKPFGIYVLAMWMFFTISQSIYSIFVGNGIIIDPILIHYDLVWFGYLNVVLIYLLLASSFLSVFFINKWGTRVILSYILFSFVSSFIFAIWFALDYETCKEVYLNSEIFSTTYHEHLKTMTLQEAVPSLVRNLIFDVVFYIALIAYTISKKDYLSGRAKQVG